jgi:hypothetical protein
MRTTQWIDRLTFHKHWNTYSYFFKRSFLSYNSLHSQERYFPILNNNLIIILHCCIKHSLTFVQNFCRPIWQCGKMEFFKLSILFCSIFLLVFHDVALYQLVDETSNAPSKKKKTVDGKAKLVGSIVFRTIMIHSHVIFSFWFYWWISYVSRSKFTWQQHFYYFSSSQFSNINLISQWSSMFSDVFFVLCLDLFHLIHLKGY